MSYGPKTPPAEKPKPSFKRAVSSALVFISSLGGRPFSRNKAQTRQQQYRAVQQVKGTLRNQQAFLRSVESGYTAKAKKVRTRQGSHTFISPNTSRVAPTFQL